MKQGYQVVDCAKCSYMKLDLELDEGHVNKIYGDDYFFGGKEGYDNYLAEEKLLIKRGKHYARIINNYVRPSRLLCVGAAAGFVMNGFIQTGWKGKGIEPNDTMANIGREKLKLDIVTGDFENYQPQEKFDLINMIQVISHFHNIDVALKNAYTFLNEDGILLVETWNKESITAKLFGKNWHQFSPPSVLRWFSTKGLIRLVEKHNFKLVKKHKSIKWISGAHAKSLINHKLSNMKASIFFQKFTKLLPEKLSFPYPGVIYFGQFFKNKNKFIKTN